PLHLAIERGRVRQCRELLEKGAWRLLAIEDPVYAWTPLHWAVHHSRKAIVRLLLRFGAQVNARSSRSGETPLHLAVQSGTRGICKLLVHKGADVNAVDNGKWTPLSLSMRNGRMDICHMLKNRGAVPLTAKRGLEFDAGDYDSEDDEEEEEEEEEEGCHVGSG